MNIFFSFFFGVSWLRTIALSAVSPRECVIFFVFYLDGFLRSICCTIRSLNSLPAGYDERHACLQLLSLIDGGERMQLRPLDAYSRIELHAWASAGRIFGVSVRAEFAKGSRLDR